MSSTQLCKTDMALSIEDYINILYKAKNSCNFREIRNDEI